MCNVSSASNATVNVACRIVTTSCWVAGVRANVRSVFNEPVTCVCHLQGAIHISMVMKAATRSRPQYCLINN